MSIPATEALKTRRITVGSANNPIYPDNKVSTAVYSSWTFIPGILWKQVNPLGFIDCY
jgi:hypothetical protein